METFVREAIARAAFERQGEDVCSVGHRVLRYYPRGWARWVPTQFNLARVGTLFFPEYSGTRG